MINLSKRNIIEVSRETAFIKDNVEKVLRLVDILDYLYKFPIADKLVLKGGTAINLAYFDMPRLSVDIDLDYTVLSREAMLEYKSEIKSFLVKVMSQRKYSLALTSKSYHALDSFVFDYINNGGNKDNIKIEINYMNRAHVLEYDKIIVKNTIVKGLLTAC